MCIRSVLLKFTFPRHTPYVALTPAQVKQNPDGLLSTAPPYLVETNRTYSNAGKSVNIMKIYNYDGMSTEIGKKPPKKKKIEIKKKCVYKNWKEQTNNALNAQTNNTDRMGQ